MVGVLVPKGDMVLDVDGGIAPNVDIWLGGGGIGAADWNSSNSSSSFPALKFPKSSSTGAGFGALIFGTGAGPKSSPIESKSGTGSFLTSAFGGGAVCFELVLVVGF